MKVLGVMGSPRIGGNTDALMDRALTGARDAGADDEKVVLDQLEINPCRDCDGCAADGECVQTDDMIALYDKIRQADGIILGTPIYWWGPTAQMKAFLDRWYAIARDVVMDRLAGKRVAFIFAFGDSDPSTARHADGMLTNSMDYLRISVAGRVFASAWKRGDIYKSPEKLDEAHQLGQTIATAEAT
jgi:multimeric flavodoxin WrbA